MWILRAFAEAKIHSPKVTHTMLGAAARIADTEGVPEDQICRAAGSTTPSMHSLAPDVDGSSAPIRISCDLKPLKQSSINRIYLSTPNR